MQGTAYIQISINTIYNYLTGNKYTQLILENAGAHPVTPRAETDWELKQL
jgi:hypothetical protein